MKIFITAVSSTFLFFALSGCLVISKVKYVIKLNDISSGYANVTYYDIRSNAIGNKELLEDQIQLFDTLWKGSDILISLQLDGKNIVERSLDTAGGKLNGFVKYGFDDISHVEGILQDSGYYYLTLQPDQEILSTNGEVIVNKLYKRIIWTVGSPILEFEILASSEGEATKDLVPEFIKRKKLN